MSVKKRKFGEKPKAPRNSELNELLRLKARSSGAGGRHKDKSSKRGKDKKIDLSDLNSNED